MIERAEKHGGNVCYSTFSDLEDSYAKEEIYPLDLKNAVARELSKVCTCDVIEIRILLKLTSCVCKNNTVLL